MSSPSERARAAARSGAGSVSGKPVARYKADAGKVTRGRVQQQVDPKRHRRPSSTPAASARAASVVVASPAPATVRLATRGDHGAIHQLLLSTRQSPTLAEFQSVNEHPRYDPNHRLVLCRGKEIVGHLRLDVRCQQRAGELLRVADVREISFQPEIVIAGWHQRMLQAATAWAFRAGVHAMTLRCAEWKHEVPHMWHCPDAPPWRVMEANPRHLLASLKHVARPTSSVATRRRCRLVVRPWRYIELDALHDLYRRHHEHFRGALVRDEAHWHWLLGRRGHDHIWAVYRPIKRDNGVSVDRMEGYAVVRDHAILELAVRTRRPELSVALLRRVAQDALEQDRCLIRWYRPAVETDERAAEVADASPNNAPDNDQVWTAAGNSERFRQYRLMVGPSLRGNLHVRQEAWWRSVWEDVPARAAS